MRPRSTTLSRSSGSTTSRSRSLIISSESKSTSLFSFTSRARALLVAPLPEPLLQRVPGEGGALPPHRVLGPPLQGLQVAQLRRRRRVGVGHHAGEGGDEGADIPQG